MTKVHRLIECTDEEAPFFMSPNAFSLRVKEMPQLLQGRRLQEDSNEKSPVFQGWRDWHMSYA